jgi:SAM-dependent methyltransferase
MNVGNEPTTCRHCDAALSHTFVDLGMAPLANSYVTAEQLNLWEPLYPLHAYVCVQCFLVQLASIAKPEDIFSDYAYFSSYSDTWVEHARAYTDAVTKRFGLNGNSFVVEIASNDGYLLQFFVGRGIPVLGIEPAANVAQVAVQKGIATRVCFFGEDTARDLVDQGKQPNLIIANNVLAHVPNLNGFVRAMKLLLRNGGVITVEVPHLMRLMQENQFDTIYHEHFSYFSLATIQNVFNRHGLRVFDVEELSTHGGSLRVYAAHEDDRLRPVGQNVTELLSQEVKAGLTDLQRYLGFGEQVKNTKRKLLEFLIAAKAEQKSVAGYGAPAKGNTLLNYCGIGPDLLNYTVDRSPHKQGRFLPGTHIPIYSPERIRETAPDYLLILPWNLKAEIMDQMKHIREWNGRFVVAIPEVRVY